MKYPPIRRYSKVTVSSSPVPDLPHREAARAAATDATGVARAVGPPETPGPLKTARIGWRITFELPRSETEQSKVFLPRGSGRGTSELQNARCGLLHEVRVDSRDAGIRHRCSCSPTVGQGVTRSRTPPALP